MRSKFLETTEDVNKKIYKIQKTDLFNIVSVFIFILSSEWGIFGDKSNILIGKEPISAWIMLLFCFSGFICNNKAFVSI